MAARSIFPRPTPQSPPALRRVRDFLANGTPHLVSESWADDNSASVRLETALRLGRPWSNADSPSVDITLIVEEAPGRATESIEFGVWPKDLPQLLACFIEAAYLGVEYGALPKMDPDGEALIRSLRAVLAQAQPDEEVAS